MSDPEETCVLCNGTGNINFDCETCDGNGWVDDPSDGGTMSCPDCPGHEICHECDGEGIK